MNYVRVLNTQLFTFFTEYLPCYFTSLLSLLLFTMLANEKRMTRRMRNSHGERLAVDYHATYYNICITALVLEIERQIFFKVSPAKSG